MGYLFWAGISVISLGGLIYGWLVFPPNAPHPIYGLDGSIALLALSALLVVVSATVIVVSRVPRRARFAVAGVLLVVAVAGVLPVAIIDLAAFGHDDGGGFLLAEVVAGMVVLAVAVIRTPMKEDHDRRPDTESRAYRELRRRSAEIDRRRTG